MSDFVDELGRQLADAEGRQTAGAGAARFGASPARRTARRAAGAVAVLAAIALLAFVAVRSAGGVDRPEPALAGGFVLDGPKTRVPGRLTAKSRALANARSAHPFETSDGTGYAYLAWPGKRGVGKLRLCLSVPGTDDPGIFFSSCRSRRVVERAGMYVSMIGSYPLPSTHVVALPKGASVVRFRPEQGPAITIPSVNGVVSFRPARNGTMSWSGGAAGTQRRKVVAYFPPLVTDVFCKDGVRIRDLPFLERSSDPADTKAAIRESMQLRYDSVLDRRSQDACRGHGGLRRELFHDGKLPELPPGPPLLPDTTPAP